MNKKKLYLILTYTFAAIGIILVIISDIISNHTLFLIATGFIAFEYFFFAAMLWQIEKQLYECIECGTKYQLHELIMSDNGWDYTYSCKNCGDIMESNGKYYW